VDRSGSQFLGGWSNPRRPISPQVESAIDRGVKHLLDNGHQIAQAILTHNRQLLWDMTQSLLEHEVLEGQQLQSYLNQVQVPTILAAWLQNGEIASEPSLATWATASENALNPQPIYHNSY
jgi:cell division protease FtsH